MCVTAPSCRTVPVRYVHGRTLYQLKEQYSLLPTAPVRPAVYPRVSWTYKLFQYFCLFLNVQRPLSCTTNCPAGDNKVFPEVLNRSVPSSRESHSLKPQELPCWVFFVVVFFSFMSCAAQPRNTLPYEYVALWSRRNVKVTLRKRDLSVLLSKRRSYEQKMP